MFKKIAATISAVGFVMLAVALAPGVPTVLATVGATTANDDTKLNQPLAQQSVPLSRLGFLIRLATACQEDCADEEASNPQLSRKSCVG
jgi:hypothetical protein